MPPAKQPDPKKKKGASDPLSFSAALDSVYAGAEAMEGGVSLLIQDANQYWFVLPDDILPSNPEADVSVPYLRFTVEGRRAAMLTRMAFMREGGAVIDAVSGKKFLLEFRPCIMLSRSKEGHSMATQVEEVNGVPMLAKCEPAEPAAPPPPPPEPEGTKIPDIGELLEGLQQTRKSLDTIDALLEAPDALMTEDEETRQELRETINATKDKALIGLGQLGDVLARGADQTLEEWREGVSQALSATIEAMVAFDDLADHVRDEKRRELEALRQSIESYFATIDPKTDMEACKKFSTGVNQIILAERKDTLKTKRNRLEKNIERSYDYIISALQQTLGKGSSLPLIPHPQAEPAEGYAAKFVLNMIHVIMVVRFGGLSIRLDSERYPRLFNELRGWDTGHPPRVHIIDRRGLAALRSSKGKKLRAFE